MARVPQTAPARSERIACTPRPFTTRERAAAPQSQRRACAAAPAGPTPSPIRCATWSTVGLRNVPSPRAKEGARRVGVPSAAPGLGGIVNHSAEQRKTERPFGGQATFRSRAGSGAAGRAGAAAQKRARAEGTHATRQAQWSSSRLRCDRAMDSTVKLVTARAVPAARFKTTGSSGVLAVRMAATKSVHPSTMSVM